MIASARTSPMPSRLIRSSRLALLRSIRLPEAAGAAAGRVWAIAGTVPIRRSTKQSRRTFVTMNYTDRCCITTSSHESVGLTANGTFQR